LTTDDTQLGKELAKLAEENPEVAEAEANLDEVTRQIVNSNTPLEQRLNLYRQQEHHLMNIIARGDVQSSFMCDDCAPKAMQEKLDGVQKRIKETEELIGTGETKEPPQIPTPNHLALIRKNAEGCGVNGRIYLSQAEALGIFAIVDMAVEALEDARDHFHHGDEACPYEEPCLVICAALDELGAG
jgi:hypothetical protein